MIKKRILVLTYWSFKEALIQSYTLPYIRIIKKLLGNEGEIYLVTFERAGYILDNEQKLAVTNQLKNEGINWVPTEYKKFGFTSLIKLMFLIPKLIFLVFNRKITHLHGWCMTGGALGYILSLFTGRKLIVDSYEPHAEACIENGDWKPESLMFRIMFFFEKRLSKHSKIVIAAAKGMKEYALEKYNASFNKFYVKPACVDLSLFSVKNEEIEEVRKSLNYQNKIVCVYAGKFGGIYLDKEVFDFFKVCSDLWGDKFRVLLLTNQSSAIIQEWCISSGFDFEKVTIKFVPHSKVPYYLSVGDFGITPVKSIKSKQYCTPIKDGEYWALGLPVVITPNISDDSHIIEEYKIGVIWNYKNKATYFETVIELNELLGERIIERKKKIRGIAKSYRSFEIAESIYKEIYCH